MKYTFVALLFICSLCSVAQTEADYIIKIHELIGGEIEVSVPNGRVDIVTDDYAYEVEWAYKWKNAIGQSLWYGLQTDKKAGIILIRESSVEFKFVQMVVSTLTHSGLTNNIQVLVYPDDFPNATMLTPKVPNSTGRYWLSKNSKKRHNYTCRWFEKSNGRYCDAEEGTAAGCCGG